MYLKTKLYDFYDPNNTAQTKTNINNHPAFPLFSPLKHRRARTEKTITTEHYRNPTFYTTVLTLLKRLAWNKCPFTLYSFLHLLAPRR